MMYDADYDIPYETKIVSMMKSLMENHTICMGIKYHKDKDNQLVLHIKIYDATCKPDIFYSEFDSAHDLARLYFKTEKFMLDRLGLKYLTEVKEKK